MIDATVLIKTIHDMADLHGKMLVMVCAPDVPGMMSEAFHWSSRSALSHIVTADALVRIERSYYVPHQSMYLMSEEWYEDHKDALINGTEQLHPSHLPTIPALISQFE